MVFLSLNLSKQNAFSVSINLIFIGAILKLNCNEENAGYIHENSLKGNNFWGNKRKHPKVIIVFVNNWCENHGLGQKVLLPYKISNTKSI